MPRQMEAKLAAERLYISSIVLLSSPSPLSITISVFLYNSYNSKLSRLLSLYIFYFLALELVLWTYTMLSSPIYSLKSYIRVFRTSRELCAVPPYGKYKG
jgi:hypothetical protein